MQRMITRQNSATAEDIACHLRACDDVFVRALESRVEIAAYADKIARLAYCIEGWRDERLVGLVAAYFNSQTRIAFITNVSVLAEAQGVGSGGILLEQCITKMQDLGAIEIRLEVEESNQVARSFYLKHAFIQSEISGNILKMIRHCEKKI
ncbi:GNAT family N-acetyltransferase [Pectobacterium polaris]|uniref:GNAT family N-acetyltransferase n=1 Tax=Pectobacterium polaris TaxID=2042057 RepID=A0AAW4P459_9GAMM|nr:GNAT family N-acetyltransferase [Pectobacterium polaris]ASY79965.1 GNAT family N-acetyltransferase [Pectobacterium polaris]MBW5894269.1 GNAT family N-acetyltransferase [Pectobacterium polaris]